MLGWGPIVWRAIVRERYGYRTEGPPFSRSAVAALPPPRVPASREYYARIDAIDKPDGVVKD